MAEVEAIILAGGYGSRLGDPFCYYQKCLLPIEGKPILGHIMDNLVAAFGSVNAYIGVGYKGETVYEYVSKNKPNNFNAAFVPDCDQGVPDVHLRMVPFVKGEFISVPGDIIARPNAYVDVMELFESSKADVSVALSSRVDEADTHSVAKLNGIHVIELTPPPPTLDPDHLRNMTIYGADGWLLRFLRQHVIQTDTGFSEPLRRGSGAIKIVGINHQDPWVHVAYQSDLSKKLP